MVDALNFVLQDQQFIRSLPFLQQLTLFTNLSSLLLFQGYLNSEEVLGKVLEGRRKNLVLASKFGTRVPQYTAEDVEVSLTNALQRLRTDYLDLYQVNISTN